MGGRTPWTLDHRRRNKKGSVTTSTAVDSTFVKSAGFPATSEARSIKTAPAFAGAVELWLSEASASGSYAPGVIACH